MYKAPWWELGMQRWTVHSLSGLWCVGALRGCLKVYWQKVMGDMGVNRLSSGTSLVVQWLRRCATTAGGMGSIPGWGTKFPRAT